MDHRRLAGHAYSSDQCAVVMVVERRFVYHHHMGFNRPCRYWGSLV